MSFSKGLQITLFTGRGDILGADSKTGAGTEGDEDTGSGAFTDVTADTGTAMAFSIRL